MRSRFLLYLLVASLFLAGAGMAWLRHHQTQVPFLPGVQSPVWLVEARIDFSALDQPVTVSLDLPADPPGFEVFAEQAASPGYGFSVVADGGRRRGEWSIRLASGPQTLYYKIQVVPRPVRQRSPIEPLTPPVVHWAEAEGLAARQLVETARARSSSPESLTRELIKLLTSAPEQNAALLLAETPIVVLLEKLLNDAQIPTRVGLGLFLEDGRRNQPLVPLLEVYARGRWICFDPRSGRQELPENFLLWSQDGRALLEVEGGRHSQVRFAMLRQSVSPLQLARASGTDSGLSLLGVHRLPVDEQNVLKMLLLLPIGALAVVFMRILVGVQTAGTFMPILIALAFLETALAAGLISFVAIVAAGLLLRGYLSRLNLLLVARISVIVIIVIFIILFTTLLGYQLGFNTGMTVTFFPIIIIAWTVERMSVLWEDEGPREVLIQGGGSLLVAVLAYLLMRWPVTAHLSFNFPEVHLMVVGLILLMGNYTGYRLLELRRFRALLWKWRS